MDPFGYQREKKYLGHLTVKEVGWKKKMFCVYEKITKILPDSLWIWILMYGARYMRERIKINVDPRWTPKIQIASTMVNRRSRFASVLRVLTQCQCSATFTVY